MLPLHFNRPRDLHEIGQMTGTDKVDSFHTWFGKSYMHRYAAYFDEMRNQPVKFLEIGVLDGASLRAWREFFPNGEIHGIDIRPECKRHEDVRNGIFVHIVDCSVVEQLNAFRDKFRGYFDVILDDGSHINDITLKTFRSFYDALKPIGYYIVEDLGCAYLRNDLKDHAPRWPGINETANVSKTNEPETMLDLYRDIHTMIDVPGSENPYQFEFLHHYTFTIILRKNEMYKSVYNPTGVFKRTA